MHAFNLSLIFDSLRAVLDAALRETILNSVFKRVIQYFVFLVASR